MICQTFPGSLLGLDIRASHLHTSLSNFFNQFALSTALPHYDTMTKVWICAGEAGAYKTQNHPTNSNTDKKKKQKMQSEDANELDDKHEMKTKQRGGLFENIVIIAVKCQLQLHKTFTEPLLE